MTGIQTQAFADAMLRYRLVAILRGVADDDLEGLTDALVESGVRLIEVALSEPSALEQVGVMRRRAPADVLVGAGTVTSVDLASAARDQGASFLVTPHVVPEVVAFANSHDLGVLCGVMTPTEIASALSLGARFLKLFPAAALGPGYIKQLLGPYPDLELFAVGGVGSANVAEFIAAGAIGAGVGGALVQRGGSADGFAVARREAVELVRLLMASGGSATEPDRYRQ